MIIMYFWTMLIRLMHLWTKEWTKENARLRRELIFDIHISCSFVYTKQQDKFINVRRDRKTLYSRLELSHIREYFQISSLTMKYERRNGCFNSNFHLKSLRSSIISFPSFRRFRDASNLISGERRVKPVSNLCKRDREKEGDMTVYFFLFVFYPRNRS